MKSKVPEIVTRDGSVFVNGIHLYQIWGSMIKGGELASDMEVAALNAEVDKLMRRRKTTELTAGRNGNEKDDIGLWCRC